MKVCFKGDKDLDEQVSALLFINVATPLFQKLSQNQHIAQNDNYMGRMLSLVETKDKPFVVTWNLEEDVDEEVRDPYALVITQDDNYTAMALSLLCLLLARELLSPIETKDKPFLVTWNLEEDVDEEEPYRELDLSSW
ncbi:hypothetical protein DdX_19961 [Ditylenchus destructor]|uniref:Uncharacterized protein n=1 Tax=Ditylenchus destructor TaxID=166010 RepID=A0AAD4MJI3_9BILA|nr:hypothetical protein DdX_19961 [Ditylenchus destructor]